MHLTISFTFISQLKTLQNPSHFGWQIELNNPKNLSHHQPTPPTFFVKTLNLIAVNHLSSEAALCMVSRFQLLENLKIIGKHSENFTRWNCFQNLFLLLKNLIFGVFIIMIPHKNQQSHYHTNKGSENSEQQKCELVGVTTKHGNVGDFPTQPTPTLNLFSSVQTAGCRLFKIVSTNISVIRGILQTSCLP